MLEKTIKQKTNTAITITPINSVLKTKTVQRVFRKQTQPVRSIRQCTRG